MKQLERLWPLRAHAGISRSELALKSGISAHMIGQLERGETEASRRTVMRLSAALGMPARELLKGE